LKILPSFSARAGFLFAIPFELAASPAELQRMGRAPPVEPQFFASLAQAKRSRCRQTPLDLAQ
jgi:hypothetical protein